MSLKKEIKHIEKDVEKGVERDIKNAEKWMHERRRFFIKLGFVAALVAVLLIISHFFLRTGGVGI